MWKHKYKGHTYIFARYSTLKDQATFHECRQQCLTDLEIELKTGGIPLWMFSSFFMGMVIRSRLKQQQELAAHTPVLDVVQLVVPCLMKWPTPSGQRNTHSLIGRHL